jgi:hypothetical protein
MLETQLAEKLAPQRDYHNRLRTVRKKAASKMTARETRLEAALIANVALWRPSD